MQSGYRFPLHPVDLRPEVCTALLDLAGRRQMGRDDGGAAMHILPPSLQAKLQLQHQATPHPQPLQQVQLSHALIFGQEPPQPHQVHKNRCPPKHKMSQKSIKKQQRNGKVGWEGRHLPPGLHDIQLALGPFCQPSPFIRWPRFIIAIITIIGITTFFLFILFCRVL